MDQERYGITISCKTASRSTLAYEFLSHAEVAYGRTACRRERGVADRKSNAFAKSPNIDSPYVAGHARVT